MIKYIIFADTNVFLDIFLQRRAKDYCQHILDLAEELTIRLFTSPSCLLTVIYFLQKSKVPKDVIISSIDNLLEVISLESPNESNFKSSLHTGFNDLEDAVQYQTARQIKGIDYFITSNLKDFKKASVLLPVVNPTEFIKIINNE